ncbi:acyl carrier protein [Streptomyces enissocaesilis]|uniref:Carrier domain-containing protein n=1 Tax=Streptomyces enissocaesilis TaxID=332589 RepID=A0ABN3XNG4_9ACTN
MPAPTSGELTEDYLVKLLREHFEIDTEHLHPDATFEELELDSLALIELLVVIEDDTGVDLQEKEVPMGPQTTLKQVALLLRQAVDASAGPSADR